MTPIYEDLLAKISVLETEIRRKNEVIARKDEDIRLKDEDIKRKSERIAYLERLLFGAKRDKLVCQGPGLFDELFDEAAA